MCIVHIVFIPSEQLNNKIIKRGSKLLLGRIDKNMNILWNRVKWIRKRAFIEELLLFMVSLQFRWNDTKVINCYLVENRLKIPTCITICSSSMLSCIVFKRMCMLYSRVQPIVTSYRSSKFPGAISSLKCFSFSDTQFFTDILKIAPESESNEWETIILFLIHFNPIDINAEYQNLLFWRWIFLWEIFSLLSHKVIYLHRWWLLKFSVAYSKVL